MNSALHMHVNVEGLFSFINNYFDVLKDTLLPIVVYETSRLLNTYKEFNAYYADGQIAYYRSVNIGVAVDIDDGLKVLTIPDTDKLLPRQIEAALSERIDRYLQRKLKPDHITGSTFTISDLSSQGLSCFQPLINKDQSAILGISGVDEKLGRSTLSLVFDHRVTEGMRACQFLNELKERVESYLPSPGRVDGSSHTEPDHRSASPAATSIRCHRCLKTLAEDQALQGPGLIKAILANGEETALCRDCMMGF
jgi:pyruvate/2-oxoglutarate dehydrogenase complex dihydrolipoamide acyltransferase (E2) component